MRFSLKEGLSYSLSKTRFFSDFNLNKYTTHLENDEVVYSDEAGKVFSYNKKKQRLTVLRQGWQLMNIMRGY
jgi:hypothetical protein